MLAVNILIIDIESIVHGVSSKRIITTFVSSTTNSHVK